MEIQRNLRGASPVNGVFRSLISSVPNLETLCSYYSLLETATLLILCKNIESFLRYDCSKWDMLFSQR